MRNNNIKEKAKEERKESYLVDPLDCGFVETFGEHVLCFTLRDV
jgi:hypothetical protein